MTLKLLPCRFLVQNVNRWELETGSIFTPGPTSLEEAAGSSSPQQQQPQQHQELAAVLDRWILAAARSLTAFVRQEMEGYRLYTVVPQLVTFIDQLTNIYVRYNRKRLKVRGWAEGRGGEGVVGGPLLHAAICRAGWSKGGGGVKGLIVLSTQRFVEAARF